MASCGHSFHKVRREHSPADQTTTLTLIGWSYGPRESTVCDTSTVASDGRWMEAGPAGDMAVAHCGDGYTVSCLGHAWEVVYVGPLFQMTS